ncbi:hypothetical protein HDE_03511 [Halotydeus destructor]|nr:hypothetical protein HDE_03511 [Halotydeus destructor]
MLKMAAGHGVFLPFDVAYDPLNLTRLDEKMYNNVTMASYIETADAQCLISCKYKDCYAEDHTPVILSSEARDRPFFDLYVSNEPEIITVFLPMFPFMDFLVFTLSCVSFWFGFSPLHFLQNLTLYWKSKRDLKERQRYVQWLKRYEKRAHLSTRAACQAKNMLTRT